MGRGRGRGIRQRVRRARAAWNTVDVNASAAGSAAQGPAVLLLWSLARMAGDPYGVGYGGALLLLPCVCVLGYVMLPVLGLIHVAVHIGPGWLLGRAVAARARSGRQHAWAWHLLGTTVVGAGWAVVLAVLCGWPFATTAAVCAALAAVPVLWAAQARRRARVFTAPRGPVALWGTSLLASFGLALLAFGVAGVASVTGLGPFKEYEPPELSAAQVAGVWRGEDGAVLRLRPDGRADATRLTAEPSYSDSDDREYVVCDGTGHWSFVTEGRDRVLVRVGGGCGEETEWTVIGTERRPELFLFVGDPDAGDLRVLRRD
ncbi:hypothetical protein [Streptomyces flavalbus]|uniref:Integral membrane protein n=1 Tax=Streptomyces flavalbus TaxID=2665155 RepID=A0ABW2WAZ2_9ACTN